MKNYRGTGDRVVVNVGASPIVSGALVHRDGITGVAETDGAVNGRVALRIVGEFEFLTSGATGTLTKGSKLTIVRASGALVGVAAGAAVPAGSNLVGLITATSADTNTTLASGASVEPKTGRYWVRIAPGGPETA